MELLANLVAAVHIGYFLFVVGGSVATLIGLAQGKAWVYNPWFRGVHLLAVMIVVAEDVFAFRCPLNTLEGTLRHAVRAAPLKPSEMSTVLDQLLRHTIPGVFLDAMYWTLAAFLLILLFVARPDFKRTAKRGDLLRPSSS